MLFAMHINELYTWVFCCTNTETASTITPSSPDDGGGASDAWRASNNAFKSWWKCIGPLADRVFSLNHYFTLSSGNWRVSLHCCSRKLHKSNGAPSDSQALMASLIFFSCNNSLTLTSATVVPNSCHDRDQDSRIRLIYDESRWENCLSHPPLPGSVFFLGTHAWARSRRPSTPLHRMFLSLSPWSEGVLRWHSLAVIGAACALIFEHVICVSQKPEIIFRSVWIHVKVRMLLQEKNTKYW